MRHEFRARAQDLNIITIDGDSMEPVPVYRLKKNDVVAPCEAKPGAR